MNFYKKIIISLLVIIFILFVSLASLPLFFKDTITAKVKTSINKGVNAKVNFSDVDLSIISTFPNLGINLNNLVIIGVDSFANDTLANIKTLQLNLNLMSIIKGKTYEINSLNLINPSIYAKVLKSGKSNWDVVKSDSSATKPTNTTKTNFKANLQKYNIENGKIIYDDASLNYYMSIEGLNHTGKGDFTQDFFKLQTTSEIEKLTVKYGGINYLNKAKLQAEIPLDIDKKLMKFTFGENQIKLNELILVITGSLAMPNDSDMVVDFKFDAKQSDLKNFLSLVPVIYANNFKDMNASGKFSFNGTTKGIYNDNSLPAFDLNLLIENGKMKYAGLPSAIDNIQVKAQINNPDGIIDHTLITIPSFQLAFGQVPIEGRLLVKTPMSDPFIDMALKGKLDLQQMTTIFPMKDIKLIGILDADIQATGNKSAIDKEQYENFKASGQILASNFSYSGKGVHMPVSVSSAKMEFSPKNISLGNLAAKVGRSDFQASGTVKNYLSYIFKKNQSLTGTFNLNSDLLDINELMGPTNPEAKKDTSKLTIIKVPANIDFLMNVTANRVFYDNYDISDAKGALQIKNQSISFKDMALEMLEGKVKMNGSYSTLNPEKPKIDIDFGIEKMNIQKAFAAFNTVKLLAPVAKYTKGEFSTNLKFNSTLGQNMMPIYSSINASGLTNIIQAVIEGFEPLNKLAVSLNTGELKKLELNNVLTKFNIENGRLNVAPFNLKKGDILMNIQGSNGLDQSIDYQLGINIPRALMGKANETANSLLASLNSKTGTNVVLNETVKLNAQIGGTILKPTIKLNLVGDMKSEAKTIVNQIIADKKAEFETKATVEVAKLTEQAKEQIQQKTDTLKKQAEQKVKDEIKNKLNNFFKKKDNN